MRLICSEQVRIWGHSGAAKNLLINTSLSDGAFVEAPANDGMMSPIPRNPIKTEARGHGASSEYVRNLIRRDLDRQELRALLGEGSICAHGEPISENTFKVLRQRAARAAGQRS